MRKLFDILARLLKSRQEREDLIDLEIAEIRKKEPCRAFEEFLKELNDEESQLMGYRVKIVRTAEKDYRKLPRDIRIRISKKIIQLSEELRPQENIQLHEVRKCT